MCHCGENKTEILLYRPTGEPGKRECDISYSDGQRTNRGY